MVGLQVESTHWILVAMLIPRFCTLNRMCGLSSQFPCFYGLFARKARSVAGFSRRRSPGLSQMPMLGIVAAGKGDIHQFDELMNVTFSFP
jgi:hypothetical protein